MRRLVQALVLIAVVGSRGGAQDAPAPGAAVDAALATRVRALVAQLASDRRAERLAAQLELIGLPEGAVPLLVSLPTPAGYESRAALEYARTHRTRAPRPIAIPAGSYAIGSDAPADRNPRRTVTLRAFRIDDVEVTCFEYFRFVRATGAPPPPPPEWRTGRYRYGEERMPVGNVEPEEAARYAEWVGGRLPTTEEWEVAGHLGDPRPYPWGAGFEPLSHLSGRLVPVASSDQDRAPSGCFDLAGSMREWVKLADGHFAARGGWYKSGRPELFRITRAADERSTTRGSSIGFRVCDRTR